MSQIDVVVIDNSSYLRNAISDALSMDEFKLAHSSGGGQPAIEFLKRKDYQEESPIILISSKIDDGDLLEMINAVRATSSVAKIISIIPNDPDSARLGIKSINSGAKDYICDTTKDGEDGLEKFKNEVFEKTVLLSGKNITFSKKSDEVKLEDQESLKPTAPLTYQKIPADFAPDIIAISSSTGGPKILSGVLAYFKGKKVDMPIFVTQHMPRDFTGLLAKQITDESGLKCVEAQEGMPVEPGTIYIAPGDFHMVLKGTPTAKSIMLSDGPMENFCRPAADPMLRSLISHYTAPKILSVVLTGMGQDGLEGCKLVQEGGGVVIAQDFETSVVWGMPGAVAKAGICARVVAPDRISASMEELSRGKIS